MPSWSQVGTGDKLPIGAGGFLSKEGMASEPMETLGSQLSHAKLKDKIKGIYQCQVDNQFQQLSGVQTQPAGSVKTFFPCHEVAPETTGHWVLS